MDIAMNDDDTYSVYTTEGAPIRRNRSYNMNIDTGEKTWLTPPHIIDALGPFDLDPCCPPKMPWQTAAEMICRPADGLAVDWRGKRVWLNPPYGREAVPFLRKMAIDGTGGGYRPHLHTHRYRRVARLYFPLRLRHPVPSRTAPLLLQGRRVAWALSCALCARRVLRAGLCPPARERACGGFGAA